MEHKMKLLAPAGDMISLKMAVYNGADEVYLGIRNFNARNNITGFDMTTLKDAVEFAHIFGVKVHLAINILFSDDNLQSALDNIVDAYNIGVDAFIVQDIGLISLIHKHYPTIEIHASTQMGIHNLEGVQYLQQFGVKRVVLARETPLSEIKRIKQNSNVELEYFCQGALCVCFSGNCYLSSYQFGASGNLGKCKQPCRLPYTLTKDGKKIKDGYLLSAKDFCMIDKLDILRDAGIDAIKIEGRARRPYYVAMTTHEYRCALDGKDYDMDKIRLAFNRTYTHGYFDGNSNIISKHNNHIGIYVGQISKVNKGKKFNEFFFSSKYNISPKSTLKLFANDKEKCTITPYDVKKQNNLYRATTTQNIDVFDKIYLLSDNNAECIAEKYTKRRKIDIQIKLIENEKMCAIFELFGKKSVIYGDTCQAAQNRPISKENVIESFNKSQFFDAQISLTLGHVFITIQQLNSFRRQVFDKIFECLTTTPPPLNKVKICTQNTTQPLEDFEVVYTPDTLSKCKNLIYSPSKYNVKDIEKFCKYCKLHNKHAFLNTPNFLLEEDIRLLHSIVDTTQIGIVANNYCALNISSDTISGAGLNIFNQTSASVLANKYLTAEGNLGGRIMMPYMTLRHCPMKEHFGCDCANCAFSDKFEYVFDNGKRAKLKRIKMSSCTFYLVD